MLAGAAGLLLLAPSHEPGEGAGTRDVSARVLEVIDGDTIAVRLADGEVERVRYIGVDTPESTPGQPLECFGHRAAEANERLVGGRFVSMRFGPERRDAYGRLLAYVYAPAAVDGQRPLFVNAALLRRGYARTLTIPPNDARAPMLRRIEAGAGRAGRGLWSACGPGSSRGASANLSAP